MVTENVRYNWLIQYHTYNINKLLTIKSILVIFAHTSQFNNLDVRGYVFEIKMNAEELVSCVQSLESFKIFTKLGVIDSMFEFENFVCDLVCWAETLWTLVCWVCNVEIDFPFSLKSLFYFK